MSEGQPLTRTGAFARLLTATKGVVLRHDRISRTGFTALRVWFKCRWLFFAGHRVNGIIRCGIMAELNIDLLEDAA